MFNIRRFTQVSTAAGLLVFAAIAARADNLVQVSDPAGQKEDSNLAWSQLGPDQTPVSGSTDLSSNKGLSVNAALGSSTATALVSKVCDVAPPAAKSCSWTGTGFPTANAVLWTTDGANGGNGPVTLSFASGIQGAGAYLQADAPGQFTASIQAFDSSNNSLGTFTATSDAAGDPVYIGVTDTSATNIASIVFSLSACSGNCADFALDNLHLNANAVLVSLSNTELVFDPQTVGTTSPSQQVTLTNTGNQPLNITSITATGDFAQTNTCGSSLAPGGNCNINVTFTPKRVGDLKGAIDIKDNSQDGDHKITLTGTGQ